MNNEVFIEELKKINIELNNNKLNQLNRYYELLVEWNEKINLTSITKKEEVYLKHFYDSLTLIKSYDLTKNIKVCDIGTGAGFPGIVLKICFPNIDITLVDALEKRVKFLNEVIKELDLKNIKVVHSRAEDFAKDHRDEFDLVTSRAVAKLNILNELCIPIVKKGGYFIPMKANIDNEIKESYNSISKLSAKLENIMSFSLPIENSNRNLVIIKKVGETKNIYPRKFDKIKKNPL
jgi:16S rRNA (guanine527-N7)-methyltransferase